MFELILNVNLLLLISKKEIKMKLLSFAIVGSVYAADDAKKTYPEKATWDVSDAKFGPMAEKAKAALGVALCRKHSDCTDGSFGDGACCQWW